MATDSKPNSKNPEEIDLLYLFVKMGEAIKKYTLAFFRLLGTILVYLLRKWYYLAMALVLTVISAVILSNVIKPHFQSDMVLRFNDKNSQVIISSLNKLGEYANDHNSPRLSEVLNIDQESADGIKNIETFRYFDIGKDGLLDGIDTEGKYLSDTSVATIDSLIVVRAYVTDPESLKELEDGINFYLESNPFLVASNKQRLSFLAEMIAQTNYELEKLDSLQKKEYYRITDETRLKEGQLVFTNERDVKLYHNQMFSLLELKKEYEKDLSIHPDIVTVLDGFMINTEPVNNAIKYLKDLIWVYLGLGLLLSLVVTYRKEIWTH